MSLFNAGDDALEQGDDSRTRSRALRWLMGRTTPRKSDDAHPWWQVVCLTGVDYFSSLGYQPGIAAVAAGALSPLATAVLVLVTVAGALPVYRRVARESFEGEGSIAMLERLLPWWGGKLVILVVLGFAITDYMITVTLSASDAAAHVTGNPIVPEWARGSTWQVGIALLLVGALCAVYLKGIGQAVQVAVALVVTFIGLNVAVLIACSVRVLHHPVAVEDWWAALHAANPNPAAAIAVAVLVFPKLALGLSGFETGVAVIPEIRGNPRDDPKLPRTQIIGARRLLTTSAVVMSVLLLWSSFVTAVLIPAAAFRPDGAANGRALSYLAHAYLGAAFGNVYDVSTIAILWFAGASAVAGLINLIPRYLPRFGMAPRWAAATRPLILLFTAIAILVVLVFDANVNDQGSAYGTGVLAVITSAAVAVTVAAHRTRQRLLSAAFALITAVFVYTTVVNVVERADGIRIAAIFIAAIIGSSALSRVLRSFQLRATAVTLDAEAQFLSKAAALQHGRLRVVAVTPEADSATFRRKHDEVSTDSLQDVIFLQVVPGDPSSFEERLTIAGARVGTFPILRVTSGAVPNSIASVLIVLRDFTGIVPDVYFSWVEDRLAGGLTRFLLFGDGEAALVTREALLRAEPDGRRRPRVHVN